MQEQPNGDTSVKQTRANVPEDVATEEEAAVDLAIDPLIAQDEPVVATIVRICRHEMVGRSIMMWMLPRSLGTSLPRRWASLVIMAGNTCTRIAHSVLEVEDVVEVAEAYKKSMSTHRPMARQLAPSLVALRLRPEAAEAVGDAVVLASDEVPMELAQAAIDYYLAPYWFLWDY